MFLSLFSYLLTALSCLSYRPSVCLSRTWSVSSRGPQCWAIVPNKSSLKSSLLFPQTDHCGSVGWFTSDQDCTDHLAETGCSSFSRLRLSLSSILFLHCFSLFFVSSFLLQRPSSPASLAPIPEPCHPLGRCASVKVDANNTQIAAAAFVNTVVELLQSHRRSNCEAQWPSPRCSLFVPEGDETGEEDEEVPLCELLTLTVPSLSCWSGSSKCVGISGSFQRRPLIPVFWKKDWNVHIIVDVLQPAAFISTQAGTSFLFV